MVDVGHGTLLLNWTTKNEHQRKANKKKTFRYKIHAHVNSIGALYLVSLTRMNGLTDNSNNNNNMDRYPDNTLWNRNETLNTEHSGSYLILFLSFGLIMWAIVSMWRIIYITLWYKYTSTNQVSLQNGMVWALTLPNVHK